MARQLTHPKPLMRHYNAALKQLASEHGLSLHETKSGAVSGYGLGFVSGYTQGRSDRPIADKMNPQDLLGLMVDSLSLPLDPTHLALVYRYAEDRDNGVDCQAKYNPTYLHLLLNTVPTDLTHMPTLGAPISHDRVNLPTSPDTDQPESASTEVPMEAIDNYREDDLEADQVGSPDVPDDSQADVPVDDGVTGEDSAEVAEVEKEVLTDNQLDVPEFQGDGCHVLPWDTVEPLLKEAMTKINFEVHERANSEHDPHIALTDLYQWGGVIEALPGWYRIHCACTFLFNTYGQGFHYSKLMEAGFNCGWDTDELMDVDLMNQPHLKLREDGTIVGVVIPAEYIDPIYPYLFNVYAAADNYTAQCKNVIAASHS
jgi:hypothetical protein